MTEAYTAYTPSSYRKIPQVNEHLSDEQKHAIDVVSQVLPFKTNNYVVDNLIDWNDATDPIFILNFPQRKMLAPEHFAQMEAALKTRDKRQIKLAADEIRWQLNPHPAGQMELNVPTLADGTRLPGIQHKYEQTALFFPNHGQTCHAYCTFCFRWPQFVGLPGAKFAMREVDLLVQYLREHPEVTDVLFTGGDPMVMRARNLRTYIDHLLDANLDSVRTVRIGTKFLGYWPQRVVTDPDADEILSVLRRVIDSGKHLAIMAHFSHYRELETDIAQQAIEKLRGIGVEI